MILQEALKPDMFTGAWFEYYAEKTAVPFLINLAIAIAIFIVGRMIARAIKKGLLKITAKRNMDQDLAKFLIDMAYAFMLAIVVIAALERLGVKTTAAIAILGAAGLAVGLALQGSLGNFAAGVMILLFKPYKTGDIVSIGGHTGSVHEIKIFVTILHTPDNRQIIMPNGQAIGGAIENYTANGTRRVDLVVGVGYGDDMKQAKDVLSGAIKTVPGVLADPAPQVAVSELGDSSVNFVVRPWCNVDDYWDVYFGTLEACKRACDEAGIEIPFPQRDLHVKDVEGKLGKISAA